jgi:hypothetical protein
MMASQPVPKIHVEPDADGRFKIIDEQSRDSDSFDETSSENDSGEQLTFSKSKPISMNSTF